MMHPADKKLFENLCHAALFPVPLAKSVPIFAWVIILVVGSTGTYYAYKEVRLRRDYQVWVEWYKYGSTGYTKPPPFSEWRHTKQARDRLTPADMVDQIGEAGPPSGWTSYPPLSDMPKN
jgi:hypothetical protein